tara:strand:- start:14740 stop:15582 length:843 start_codon:yes stop_codon:yes gene_type:complete
MSAAETENWFDGIESVVSEPLKFKAKLAIGEEAYTSLRLKNTANDIWDVAGVATVTASVAKSAAVASTFFTPTGILAFLGVGTAVTPVGWVIAASVLASGAWFGITRHLKSVSSGKVTTIPTFINTPMDVIALGLFDLIAPLALKIADVDGHIHEKERELIISYFVNEWGYDSNFVNQGITFTESKLSEFKIKEVAKVLAEFKKANPDCNYKTMTQETLSFLKEIIEVDGKIDEREEMAVEKVEAIFEEINQISFKKIALDGMGNIKEGAERVISKLKPN